MSVLLRAYQQEPPGYHVYVSELIQPLCKLVRQGYRVETLPPVSWNNLSIMHNVYLRRARRTDAELLCYECLLALARL